MDTQKRFRAIREKINGGHLTKHGALDVADELFSLIGTRQVAEDEIRALQATFTASVIGSDFPDLTESQMRYAIKIADAPGNLLYEEMHKLFSLCDTVYALEYLGLPGDNALKNVYEESVKNRFLKEKANAKLTAEDKSVPWKTDFWWYKMALSF